MIISLVLVLLGLLDNYLKKTILSLIFIFVFYQRLKGKKRILYIGVIVAYMVVSIPFNSSFNQGYVDQIKDNYVVIRNGYQRIIVYDNDNYNYDDIITINEEIKPIQSYNNFENTTFSDYCKGNNIIGYVQKGNLIKKGDSLRNKLYQYNNQHQKWINSFLFSDSLPFESDNEYLVLSSGMHISFLAYFLTKILDLFIYHDKSQKIVMVIVFLLSYLFNFPYGYLRVFINLLANYFIDDKEEKLSCQITVLALLKPYYINSVSFLLPVGLKAINTYGYNKRKSLSFIYIMAVQLYIYGYCDLSNLIFFSLIRNIFGYLYVSAFLLIGTNIDLTNFILNIVMLIDKFSYKIYGSIDIYALIFIVCILYVYNCKKKNRYLFINTIFIVVRINYHLFFPFYSVTYLDVGQGDCAVISLPFNNKALLIDTGGNHYKDIGNDIVIPYLAKEGFKQIDVIISHDDYDHKGALENIENNFNVNKIYEVKQEYYCFSNLKIFNPLFDEEYEDLNDNSTINYFKANGVYYLFLGDISGTVEKDLIQKYQLTVNVLKLSHHGSNTATSQMLLENYQPDLAIISSGRNNVYHHPSYQTIQRLNDNKISFLNTQQSSAIKTIPLKWFTLYLTGNKEMGIIINK